MGRNKSSSVVKLHGKELVPLRINEKTIIYVTPDKQNEEYAESYRQRLKKCRIDFG